MKMILKNKLMAGVLAGCLMVSPISISAAEQADLGSISLPSGDLAIRTPSDPMGYLSSSDAEQLNDLMAGYEGREESLLKNQAKSYYYYERIDPTAKQIYDVLYGVCEDPVNEGNIGLLMTDMDPKSDEFYDQFNIAYRAICFDHPELFWLYSGEKANIGFYSEAVNMGGFYFVYMKMIEPFVEFDQMMTKFNNAADAFLADINTGVSEYFTVKQIHDKLIDLVNYNDPVCNQIRFSRGQDLAHTAYGALVEDSSGIPNYCVCDGYTLTMEYMLQQVGIDAVFIGGMAGSDEDSVGGHAWNVVKVDGVWYELDATWDDAYSAVDDLPDGSSTQNYILELLGKSNYRDLYEHFLFLVSTDTIRHWVPSEEYDYVTDDQRYVYNLCQESVHIRMGEDGDLSDCDSKIISSAPRSMQSFM